MSIDLRVLQYLVRTVDTGSANSAARSLHITQPTLSRQLRQLERDLGLQIFERQGTRLVLTRQGRQFLPRARELLQAAANLRQAADHLASGQLERVHLAVPTTTLSDVLAPFLATLHEHDPIPTVEELDPHEAVAALRAGSDLAIVTQPPHSSLASQPLARLPVFALVPPDDAWARRSEIALADLAERDLVLLSGQFRPRILLESAFHEAGIVLDRHIECDHPQIAQALAAAGRGVAVVSDDPRFDLVPLRIVTRSGPLRIHLYAAWDRHHHAAATLEDLSIRLARFCVDRYGTSVAPDDPPPRRRGSPPGPGGPGGDRRALRYSLGLSRDP